MSITVEEMRQAIQDKCDEYGVECPEECPLHPTMDEGCFMVEEDDIKDRYIRMFGVDPNAPVEEVPVEHDVVNHPNHYTNGDGMECIDEMILLFGCEVVKHFCLCNVWKYRRRAMYKNGEEDMKKSHWYIAKYQELERGSRNELIERLKSQPIQTI